MAISGFNFILLNSMTMELKFSNYLEEVMHKVKQTSTVTPKQRACFKSGYTFSNLSFAQQLPIWNEIWMHVDDFHVRTQAFFFIESVVNKTEHYKVIWETVRQWQEKVSNWGHCDALAKIFTKLLERKPEEVYEQLILWNTDKDLWKRRQSVVSLLYFHRTKSVFLAPIQIETQIQHLLTDKEYYVQKGVGWALREYHSVYPLNAKQFLQNHLHSISAIAFTIAIEKMSVHDKTELKNKRKSGRKNNI